MKFTMNHNTVYAFATQRNAYQNYILLLTNNFKFYILQILGHLNFLSVGFVLQNIFSFNKNSCSFFVEKKNQKTTTFFVKKVDKKTTSLVFKNLIVKTFSQYLESLFVNKLIHAFSGALKNHFEIISQSNYGFCYKNYFFNLNQVFRNNYDFCESFERNSNYDFGRDYNYKNNCDYSFEKNYNFGFGKNDFGNCNFGLGFWNEIYNLKNNLAGFLFNRKINSKKILFQKEKKR